ncbi:PR domain zinc finger protein 10-like isoform X2 [Ischnura elegans]|uniref:PR domain zinc finger protein 10-like isoform X2 n=1 Tax=Ischnura elegans TaxID=197161 RepID=UPI001ED88A11|nr:PR domain zinc finger protein 10-like isoform X2 [Ischnura elegans]
MELFPEGELLDIESVELVICDNNEACLADLVVGQEANDLSVVVQSEIDEIERHGSVGGSVPPKALEESPSEHHNLVQLPVVVPTSVGGIKSSSNGGTADNNLDTPCGDDAMPDRHPKDNELKNHCALDDSIISEELGGERCMREDVSKTNFISSNEVDNFLSKDYCEVDKGGEPIDSSAHHSVQLRRSKRHATRNNSTKDESKQVASNSPKGGDSYIEQTWNKDCDDCDFSYGKECPNHKIQSISDKPVPSRAWATLPGAYLMITKVSTNTGGGKGHGVFARKTIPKRTQFGPVEGVIQSKNDHTAVRHKLELLVESENGEMRLLDVSDENSSNWMRFVRTAKNFKDINLILSQQGHSLYFTTTRLIHPREELLVWYSLPYAQRRGLPILTSVSQEKKVKEEIENWPCFECNDKFHTSEQLQKHLNDVHDQSDDGSPPRTRSRQSSLSARRKSDRISGEYKCQTCNRTFPRNYSLKRHLVLHTGEKKYSCNICGLQFSHPYNKDRHFKKHLRKVEDVQVNGKDLSDSSKSGSERTPNEWLCIHCSLSFDSPSVLSLHTLEHAAENLEGNLESEETKDWEEAADIILAFASSSVSGKKLAADFAIKTLHCPQCKQNFPSKKELIIHASAHGTIRRSRGALNPSKPHKCELCYKAFASEDRLQKHMLVHGTEESKPLQCDVCYKRFLNNSALACHIKVHTEEKTFECPICREIFYQVLALKEHVHVHCHEGVFTCPHCGKVCEDYNLIRKHVRTFHSDRRFPCSVCEKVFPRPDKLKLHMLRHSDHREFLCANCGKQFKRKDKLKEHMKRMHSPEREAKLSAKPARPPNKKKFVPKVSPTDYQRFIYKCHACLVGFKRRGMLVNHLAKRHPDVSPDTVPELNLPILKTTRDYYCQYCEKVYKSSSKRKAHILKNHPGAELPMSNRKKGGTMETLGFHNPSYSQTVGSITTHAHNCNWCHKQYASKPKLLQHQRKKHLDLLPQSQQVPRTLRTDCVDSPASVSDGKYLSGQDETHVIHLQDGDTITSDVNMSVEYETTTVEKLRDYPEGGILIDPLSMKSIKAAGDENGAADLLAQAMSELAETQTEYRLFSGSEHYFKIIHTTPAHIMVAPTESLPPSPCPSPSAMVETVASSDALTLEANPPISALLTPSTLSTHPPSTPEAAVATDSSSSCCSSSSSLSSLTSTSSSIAMTTASPMATYLTPVSVSVSSSTLAIEPSQLQHILTCSPTFPTNTLPLTTSVSPSPSVLPRTWAATYTSYTAR